MPGNFLAQQPLETLVPSEPGFDPSKLRCAAQQWKHGFLFANALHWRHTFLPNPVFAGNWTDLLPDSNELRMKAYIAELNNIDVNMSVPLEGNGSYLCFDIDKYGRIAQVPRIIRGPFLKKGFHREVRIADELVLSVRTVAEVARATEPLIAKMLDDCREFCENWSLTAQEAPAIDV